MSSSGPPPLRQLRTTRRTGPASGRIGVRRRRYWTSRSSTHQGPSASGFATGLPVLEQYGKIFQGSRSQPIGAIILLVTSRAPFFDSARPAQPRRPRRGPAGHGKSPKDRAGDSARIAAPFLGCPASPVGLASKPRSEIEYGPRRASPTLWCRHAAGRRCRSQHRWPPDRQEGPSHRPTGFARGQSLAWSCLAQVASCWYTESRKYKIRSGAKPNEGFRINVDGRSMSVWGLWARFRSELGWWKATLQRVKQTKPLTVKLPKLGWAPRLSWVPPVPCAPPELGDHHNGECDGAYNAEQPNDVQRGNDSWGGHVVGLAARLVRRRCRHPDGANPRHFAWAHQELEGPEGSPEGVDRDFLDESEVKSTSACSRQISGRVCAAKTWRSFPLATARHPCAHQIQ